MRDNYNDVRPWVGIDFDGTLVEAQEKFHPQVIGSAVMPIVKMAREMLAEGKRVKIFTARVCVTGQSSDVGCANERFADIQHLMISMWCQRTFGVDLEITCIKDFLCEEIYDDRAWRVEKNTGKIVGRDEVHRHYCSVSGYGLPVHESEHEDECRCPKDGHSERCPIHRVNSSPR